MKEREEKNSGRKKKVRKKSRTTEFSITVVLCCLVAVLTVKGISLQQKVNANASRLSSLDSQIEEEKQRTDDITALKDRKSTRLNSSHRCIPYAVFCLKKNIVQSISVISLSSVFKQ